MAVCSFFLKGNCRYGSACKNSHVVDGPSKTALGGSLPGPDAFSTMANTLRDDFSKEKPAYYLSVYACQKCAPNLIDGTDVSPEELRFQAYQARASNTTAQYVAHESQLLQQMDSVIQMASENTLESYKHFFHTRIPLNSPHSTFRKATPGPTFGGASFGSANPAAAFGKPATAFGGPSTGGFGTFGSQPVASSVSAFGQPSQVRPTVSAFGQPNSAFGVSPAQPSPVTAFGKPSAFGVVTSGASAFGGASTPSAFGHTSQFGSTSTFGAGPSPQPTAVTAFGAPSVFAANPQSNNSITVTAFGQASLGNPSPSTAFGQPSLSNSTTSFGQPSAFGQPQVATAFGQRSPFAQTAFGKQASFGSTASNPSSCTTTAFGQPAFGGSSATAFGQAAPLRATATSNQAGNGGGFAAFAGNPNPSMANTFGSNNTSTTEANNLVAPEAISAFAAPSTKSTSPFVTSSVTSDQPKKQNKSQKSPYRPTKLIKSLDPFWEDAPNEADLSSAILDAFKAESFSWGEIPNVPPPITLR